jgi:hypothetical protein
VWPSNSAAVEGAAVHGVVGGLGFGGAKAERRLAVWERLVSAAITEAAREAVLAGAHVVGVGFDAGVG